MEKRDSEIFMQSRGRQLRSISRDAGEAAAQSNQQCQWEDHFHAIEHEKRFSAAVTKTGG